MRKRGRPHKHWAELARITAWYCEIKKRSPDWTDYQLDVEFAWKLKAKSAIGVTGKDRPRTFEWMRKKGRVPHKSWYWRSMSELLDAVEEHELFRGTKELYEAPIWNLCQQDSLTYSFVNNEIDRILKESGLVRISRYDDHSLMAIAKEKKEAEIYARCLKRSLKKVRMFDRIPLMLYLYLMTSSVSNGDIRLEIEIIMDERLNLFFWRFLPRKEHLTLYSFTAQAFRRMRLVSDSKRNETVFPESQGRLIVLPKELLGKITIEELYTDWAKVRQLLELDAS